MRAATPDVRTADPVWVADAARRTRRYLRCLRCPRDEADDLVQDTLVVALEAFDGRAPALPWLFVTARHRWFQACRRQGRVIAVADLEQLHERAVRELGDDGGDARLDALRACVGELPPRAQLALRLRYRDGLARAELAVRLAMTEEGVKSLLDLVRAALKRCVGRRRDDDA
jgi:RNA polymerase sigma factor (sigma-70 family)